MVHAVYISMRLYEALKLAAEVFGDTPDGWAARAIRADLEYEADDSFSNYADDHFKPLAEKIKELLAEEVVDPLGSLPQIEG